MLRSCLAGLALAPLLGAAPPSPEASPQAYYSAALSAMRDLPQPQFVTYQLEGQSDGLQVGLTTQDHKVWLLMAHGTTPASWDLRHRTDDYETEIVNTANGRRYVTQRSFFDPTWYGSYRALRDGMLGYQDVEPPISSHATPAPAPSPTALKTIAVEAVMGPGIYAVHDAGPATCSNGDPGHALHLTPRSHDPRRQLSDVIVDTNSMRFCMIRYGWDAAFGFHGIVEQHYANVGGYWMQTDGLLDGTLRVFGISTHHGIWRYRLTDMQFPQSIPDPAFVPDPTQ